MHRQALVTHLTSYDVDVSTRLANVAQTLATRLGQFPINTQRHALWLLDATVTQQAGIMSYNDAFRLVGFCFLGAMPLLLLVLRRPAGAAPVVVILSDH